MKTLLVRLRPRSPKSGLFAKDFRYLHNKPGSKYHGKWFVFTRPNIWHKVPVEIAQELEKIRQNPHRSSPAVFDVHTEHEARTIDVEAKAIREAKQAIVEPTVDTAVDMTVSVPTPMAPKPAMSPALQRLHAESEIESNIATPEPVGYTGEKEAPIRTPFPVHESGNGRCDIKLQDIKKDPVVDNRQSALNALKAIDEQSSAGYDPGASDPSSEPGSSNHEEHQESEESEDVASMEWNELRSYAKLIGVAIKRGMTKEDVIKEINNFEFE